MKKEVVGILLAVLVAGGLGIGYLVGSGGKQSTGFASTSTVTTFRTVAETTTVQETVTSTAYSEQPIPIAGVESANLSIGGSSFAIDPNTSTIYVATDSSQLTVVDASSNSVLDAIDLPSNVTGGIAIDYSTDIVYVLVSGGVAEVNGTTNKVVGEIPVDLDSIAVNPLTHTIYGISGDSLVELDPITSAPFAKVSLGYFAFDLVVIPRTNLAYAVGCEQEGLACNSVVSVVNGTSGTLIGQVLLHSPSYPAITVDEETGIVYVAGMEQLTSMIGNGTVLYSSDPLTCGPFVTMGDIPSSNQVIMAPQNYNFLLFYDGSSLALLNMYSLPAPPSQVAYDQGTNEVYMLENGNVIAFHPVSTTGNVNATLIGAGKFCPLP